MKHNNITLALSILALIFCLPTMAALDLSINQEITGLLQNPTFQDQFNGWTLTQQGGSITVQETTSGTYEVQSQGCEFTLEQTVTGLPDGIYELQIDGYYAAESMPQSTLHGSMIYLNDMKNVLKTSSEYSTENPTNKVVAKPEDGKLTVRIMGLRIASQDDVTVFSNLHLFYRGAGETGYTACKNVETEVKNSAGLLLECGSKEVTDYRQHPMCQISLINRLADEVLNKNYYGTVDMMLQHLGSIGNYFSAIGESRAAYIRMMDNVLLTENTANILISNNLLSEKQYSIIAQLLDTSITGYTEGSFTTSDIDNQLQQIAALDGLPKFNDNIMQISSPNDLCSFSVLVNEGMRTLDAQLTADINMAGITTFQPIGLYSDNDTELSDYYTNSYGGTFNGQGFEIRNLKLQTNCEGGLFGRCYRAHISNLGMVNVTVTGTGAQTCGALAGTLMQTQIDNCYVAGSIQVNTNGKTAAEFAGEGAWNTCFNNCYTLGDDFTNASAAELNNCYWGTIATKAAKTGELCYNLNNGETIDPVFFQTLGKDNYPVLQSTHEVVRRTQEGNYYNGDDIDAIGSIQDSKFKSQNSESMFDLSGRRISSKPAKGMYIQGGKVRL